MRVFLLYCLWILFCNKKEARCTVCVVAAFVRVWILSYKKKEAWCIVCVADAAVRLCGAVLLVNSVSCVNSVLQQLRCVVYPLRRP